jgi:hypothetical protein
VIRVRIAVAKVYLGFGKRSDIWESERITWISLCKPKVSGIFHMLVVICYHLIYLGILIPGTEIPIPVWS